jgi:hypothetical protein
MKLSLPNYLEYGKTYDERAATKSQESIRVIPARLSRRRALLLLITLFLLSELAFLAYQIMWIYPVTSHYIAGVTGQKTDATIEQYSTRLAAFVDHYNAIASQLAEDPKIARLFIAGDEAAMRAEEKSLQLKVPKALNVKLLPAGLASVNLSTSPPLGYAALDQIRLSENGTLAPPMEAHLIESPQQHINIVRGILDPAAKIVVGHIMMSLPYDILQGIFDAPKYAQGYIELQQTGTVGDPILLAAQGDIYDKTGDATRIVPINDSRWQIAYWASASSQVYLFSISVAMLCAALLLSTGLLLFIVILFRRLIKDILPATE